MYSRANSSRTSSTCARVAPTASARSRTSVSSRLWPRSSVTAMTSPPYCSASHAIATDVSRPPEYARTMRSMLDPLSLHPLIELTPERLRLVIAPADHENGVLAADRADHLRQPGGIDRFGERRRLRRFGPEHDRLLNDVEAAQGAGNHAAQDGAGIRRDRCLPDQRTPVSPVGRSLYEPQVADVPR